MPKLARKTLIVVAWLLIWQFISIAVGNSLLLAGPIDTVVRLVNDVVTPAFWNSIAFSACRIIAGFLIAFASALILGTLAWRFKPLREFLAPAVSFIKSVPVVCIIVLLLVWMGAAWISIIAVALMVFPPVYTNYLEGLKQTDAQMVQMLDVYQVGPWQRLRYYYLPLVLPFLASASRVVVGISWKAGIAAEVIGIPNGSIGAGIYLAKIGLDTAGLFSWTLVIVLFSVVCEKAFLGLLKAAENWTRRVGKSRTAGVSRTPDSASDISPAQDEASGVGFKSVSFSYADNQQDEHAVLYNYTQDFALGGRYCLMGPSGVGKSTLLTLACGLVHPSSGKVHTPQRVSMMFQEDRLFEQLSAWDNVRLTSSLSSEDLSSLKLNLDKTLDRDSVDLPLSSCSGGMKRKVALFRALAAPGEALFLDEPFTGMDDKSKADAIATINRNLRGRTLIAISHDVTDAALLNAEIVEL